MNDGMLNPMAGGNEPAPETPNPGGPINPMPPAGPSFDSGSSGFGMDKIFKIMTGVLGFLLIILIILVIVYAGKANKTKTYIEGVVKTNVDQKVKAAQDSCEQQKKDLLEKPWKEYKARDEFGAFKFQVPKNWSQYEHFDMSENEPYQLYFNPDTVQFDSSVKKDHAALEVGISKNLYDNEVKDLKSSFGGILNSKTEEKITISNFTGTIFIYKDQDLNRNIGVIMLPYRDRTLFIKTDDYDKWNDQYFSKFYKSFSITP